MKRLWRLALLLLLALAWIPAPSAYAADCTDEAELVEVETDPTGVIAPDETVTVVWTVRNAGDCTWDRDYRMLFISGDRLDGPRTARLRTRVTPGATLTLTLDLTAPAEAGAYTGTWRLRGPEGATFGPDLTVTVEVGEAIASSGEVILPEVLAFGGMGGGGEDEFIDPCLDADGFLLAEPGIAFDATSLPYRYANLYVCGFAEGSELAVMVTDPQTETFTRTYTVDAARVYTDVAGLEYAQTWVAVNLSWHDRSPAGVWTVRASDGELEVAAQLEILTPEPLEDADYPRLTNYPLGPIDPFAAAEGCTYAYEPGATLVVEGVSLLPDTALRLGLYEERLAEGYLVDEQQVTSAPDGTLRLEYTAPQPGNYQLMLVHTVDPSGYLDDNVIYDVYFGPESATTCFTVKPPEQAAPWRLAFAQGAPGAANVSGMDMQTGLGFFPTYHYGECDTTNPSWWPDGVWLLYTSNCVAGEPDAVTGWISYAAGAYDLYAVELIPGGEDGWRYETLQLTSTPAIDETEPAASVDGLIAYRQAPTGTSPEASGDLWLLDLEANEIYDLGLTGRAPVWSPDGTRLAFMSDLEGTWQVYVYDFVEETLWAVDERCPSHCRFPAWSPDGRELVYSSTVSARDLTPAALWVAPAEGGRARRLLSGEFDHPTWSTTGWIAFSGVDGIYRVRDDARSPTAERYLYAQIDLDGPLREAVWSR